jgi:hypothetical protein
MVMVRRSGWPVWGLVGMGLASPLGAQAPAQASWSLLGGFIAPFGDMKSRSVGVSVPVSGLRQDAFSNGFSLQASLRLPGAGRLRGRGSLGICGMNGTSTGAQHTDLEYLAYGLGAGWELPLGAPGHGFYGFSELHFDREMVNAKSPGTGWASLFGSQGSRTCIRVGLGLGMGWMVPASGFTVEVEARSSLTGPISNSTESERTHVFWASLPPDRYIRVGLGWTWGHSPR